MFAFSWYIDCADLYYSHWCLLLTLMLITYIDLCCLLLTPMSITYIDAYYLHWCLLLTLMSNDASLMHHPLSGGFSIEGAAEWDVCTIHYKQVSSLIAHHMYVYMTILFKTRQRESVLVNSMKIHGLPCTCRSSSPAPGSRQARCTPGPSCKLKLIRRLVWSKSTTPIECWPWPWPWHRP